MVYSAVFEMVVLSVVELVAKRENRMAYYMAEKLAAYSVLVLVAD